MKHQIYRLSITCAFEVSEIYDVEFSLCTCENLPVKIRPWSVVDLQYRLVHLGLREELKCQIWVFSSVILLGYLWTLASTNKEYSTYLYKFRPQLLMSLKLLLLCFNSFRNLISGL